MQSLCAGSITAYSLYGPLFLARLHYSQLQVNVVSIAAELGMYLPVPLWGFLCDRYGPRLPSLFAGVVFGLGYLLAAFTYRHGPSRAAGGEGWPFGVMVLAFVGVGMGTSCMYLSAVTTCAKNFGRGRHKGFALAMPIAAFGLSGMWQSQVGSRLLYEDVGDGRRGEVDVFKYFLFLGITLLIVGIVGAVGLRIVDEEALIDEAVDELERSGLLEDSPFFQHAPVDRGYGTLDARRLSDDDPEPPTLIEDDSETDSRKKIWLLNAETRAFLHDPTMWFLAAGFFLVTGPGEAFINNLGTIIGTLYPPPSSSSSSSYPAPDGRTPPIAPTSPATHVSIVALTSTLARILTGTLSDLLAPPSTSTSSQPLLPTPQNKPTRTRHHTLHVSRLTFLLTSTLLLSAGQIVLASGAVQNHAHDRFWIVSALVGAGYGAVFSLVPIVCGVVWGVDNFGTNWGIVAMVPAVGASVWGVVFAAGYSLAAGRAGGGEGIGGGVGARGLLGWGMGKGMGMGMGGMLGVGRRGGEVVVVEEDVLCYGPDCYAATFWAMAVSVWLAAGLWLWAWKGPGGWSRRGIAV